MASTSPDAREQSRLEAVQRYGALETPPGGSFDRITALAARLFNVPIAIVSIVDQDRIWFKSHEGLDVEDIPREPGLCLVPRRATSLDVADVRPVEVSQFGEPLLRDAEGGTVLARAATELLRLQSAPLRWLHADR